MNAKLDFQKLGLVVKIKTKLKTHFWPDPSSLSVRRSLILRWSLVSRRRHPPLSVVDIRWGISNRWVRFIAWVCRSLLVHLLLIPP